MTMQTKPRLPDRSGMLIPPGSLLVATTIFAVILVVDAVQIEAGTYTKTRVSRAGAQVVGEMAAALARALGVVPSIIVGVAAVLGMGVWFYTRLKAYRALVAEDRRAAGL